eukprot:766873-Rhodomonas_salina.3
MPLSRTYTRLCLDPGWYLSPLREKARSGARRTAITADFPAHSGGGEGAETESPYPLHSNVFSAPFKLSCSLIRAGLRLESEAHWHKRHNRRNNQIVYISYDQPTRVPVYPGTRVPGFLAWKLEDGPGTLFADFNRIKN